MQFVCQNHPALPKASSNVQPIPNDDLFVDITQLFLRIPAMFSPFPTTICLSTSPALPKASSNVQPIPNNDLFVKITEARTGKRRRSSMW
jgi:hypothetical protein